jgi:hypothetical protein
MMEFNYWNAVQTKGRDRDGSERAKHDEDEEFRIFFPFKAVLLQLVVAS